MSRLSAALRRRYARFMRWGTLLFFVVPALSTPAMAQTPDVQNGLFSYILIGVIAVVLMIAYATVRSSLISSPWSLSDALSEEANLSPLDSSSKPIPGQLISALRASSSRFIALLGLIGILVIYLGFGIVVLQRYASDGALPQNDDIKKITLFLFSGVTMFAPYLINQFSSVFDWLKPPK